MLYTCSRYCYKFVTVFFYCLITCLFSLSPSLSYSHPLHFLSPSVSFSLSLSLSRSFSVFISAYLLLSLSLLSVSLFYQCRANCVIIYTSSFMSWNDDVMCICFPIFAYEFHQSVLVFYAFMDSTVIQKLYYISFLHSKILVWIGFM